MTNKKLLSGLLLLSLTATPVLADTAAKTSTANTAKAVDPAVMTALNAMGTYLRTLQKFEVSSAHTSEQVLEDGQKIEKNAQASITVQLPNKLHATMQSASMRELFYDGKTATLYTPSLKYYTTVETADTIGGMITQASEKYGIEIPMRDLFIWGTPAASTDKIESAMNVGQEYIDGDLCDHYIFRQPQVDWQLWIKTGDKPLPRKLVITNRADEARPQSSSILSWNLKPAVKNSDFKFSPPKGAKPIAIRDANAK